MYVVCVTVFVKPEKIKDFKEETFKNARNTRKEPGNIHFNIFLKAIINSIGNARENSIVISIK